MLGGADSIPLLHIANAPARATIIDVRVLVSALLLLLAVATAIWLRCETISRGAIRRRRFWRSATRTTISALVFLALLPAVLPYDHLFLTDAHAAADEAIHESHCHVSPGSCTDAPVTSGLGQLLLTDPLAVAPAMLAVLLVLPMLALRGISLKPNIRPPRIAA
jgi:hypothetical protein